MYKIKTVWCVIAVVALTAPCWAMGNKTKPLQLQTARSGGGGGSFGDSDSRSGGSSGTFGDSGGGRSVSDMANAIGNNDALQQLTGDLGGAAVDGGKWLANDAWNRHFNQGATMQNTNHTLNNATRIVGYGGAVNIAAQGAPHVGWAATSAGRAAEGDYAGAAIQGVNGCGRTIFVSKTGAAAGAAGAAWAGGALAGGKLGAMAGSWAGPLGVGAGFVIGAGAAWVAGLGWDNTVGAGANALDQRVADWQAHSQYAGQGNRSGGAGGSWDYTPDSSLPSSDYDAGVAGSTPDIGRDAARNAAQQSRQAPPRPVHRPSAPCRGDGRCR